MTDGAVVWLTGLPGAGKSTLASRLASRLRAAAVATAVLDSDEVRAALVPSPGHDDAGRDHFYRSLAGLAVMLARQGLVVLVPATAHRRAWRDAARADAARFVEVLITTPVEECRRRDPKGLYASPTASAKLPGVGVTYEPPLAPEVVARGGDDADAVERVLAMVSAGAHRAAPG
jgi:adenylylsulfate kinase